MASKSTMVDFIIVGGGILGAAVATIASAAGYGVLVLRLADAEVPRADTLRNQGWLQSGIMYRPKDFKDLQACAAFANRTFIAGRRMLQDCGLPLVAGNGMLAAKKESRVEEVLALSKALRFTDDEFRELGTDEVAAAIGDLADPTSRYFAIPDVPFDEAGVLNFLRDRAAKSGAVFVEVSDGVRLERRDGAVIIHYDGVAVESRLTLVTAGCGSFELLRQLGLGIDHELRRTPLLVSDKSAAITPKVFVDTNVGFSAVQHQCPLTGDTRVVVGTRVHDQPTGFVAPDARTIPRARKTEFEQSLHPEMARRLMPSRFTAGYEVMPSKGAPVSQYEPWIEDLDDVVFASPGRATVAFMAATEVLNVMLGKVRGPQFACSYDNAAEWQAPISMHFTGSYSFDDAER